MPEFECDFPSIHFVHVLFFNLQLQSWHYFKIFNQPDIQDTKPCWFIVHLYQGRPKRTKAVKSYSMYSIYSYSTSNHNIQLLSIVITLFFHYLQWHQIMLVLLYQIWYRKWNGLIMICRVHIWATFIRRHRPPFWTTELWLLSGALWFLGETRIEVVDLAVIQRKCAKCYQNWINRWQLRLMKGIEQEKGSFQVTHEWNFKLYAICWIWVSILHLLCCDIVANYLVLVDHCITVLYIQFISYLVIALNVLISDRSIKNISWF